MSGRSGGHLTGRLTGWLSHPGRHVLLLGVLALVLTACTQASADPQPAVMRTTPPPWPAPADAVAHAEAAGLTVYKGEPRKVPHGVVRVHVIVDGRAVPVPAQLGRTRQGEVAALSTPDRFGRVQVLRDGHDEMTLGQFFILWGVRFDERCLGSACATGSGGLRVYVDGQPSPVAPGDVPLRDGTTVVVSLR